MRDLFDGVLPDLNPGKSYLVSDTDLEKFNMPQMIVVMVGRIFSQERM